MPALSGVITPILTPFDDDLTLAPDLYCAQAHWLLEQGMHYLAPFGTTGEALSLTAAERMAAVDALVAGGIDPGRLMPGAGLCNLPETVALVRHAREHGCAAVMTLPPFFYKNASDDGLYAHFAQLIDTVGDPGLRICLYHIPPMAGIGFSPGLAARLAADFPDTVVAYKDSSGDFEHTRAVLEAAPGLAVFPGAETFLVPGLEHGAAGCISATGNINPAGIRRVYDLATAALAGEEEGDLHAAAAVMLGVRRQVEGYAPIPAMKGLLAAARKEPRWAHVRAPLVAAEAGQGAALAEALGEICPDLVPGLA